MAHELNSIRPCARSFALLALFFIAQNALAVDLLPGELIPQPPGTHALQLGIGNAERNDQFENGRRTKTAPNLRAESTHLRYAYFLEVAGMPAVAYVQQTWGGVDVKGVPGVNEHTSGRADPIFLLGFWPHADREKNSYLAVAGYYVPGSGNYDNRDLSNTGENRDKGALQVAYQRRVLPNFDWMAALDVVRYSTNSNFSSNSLTLDQKKLHTLQTSFTYHFAPTTSLALSLFHTWGGETVLNGNERNDEVRVNRGMLTLIQRFPQYRTVVHLQYGRDFNTENGYLETSRTMLRITRAF